MTPREILERLVAFPTVSTETNIPLIDWVADHLAAHGIASHRMPDDTGTKHALFASVGPDAPGGIVLSGHTDVVPVEGQDWTTDPWQVTEKDGRLYGRGTCDMKGFDALAVAAMVKAKSADLKRPLQIAFSFDEEIGCEGAPPLIRAMDGVVPKAATAIIGEPSMMKVVTGHKGSTGFQLHVRGFEVHSSLLPDGVSAILESARIINWINERNAENAAKAPGPLAANFNPPWTTLHVGMIKGGTAHNITAKDAYFDMEFRVVPGESVEEWADAFLAYVSEVEAAMQAVQPSARITTDRYFGVPGLQPESEGEAETLARRITGDNGTHVVSYGTEAGHFQNAGYSSVICGPGDIAQAHQADEFVAIEQLKQGEAFLDKVIDTLTRD
ncbi:MAG: acetylornithine deacetylase [Pseudomonadota bacterium]